MSTRAQRERAEEEKKGPRAKKVKKLTQRKEHVHHQEKGPAKRSAYGEETTAPGKRPSRKSTRGKSKAALKHDTNETRHRQRADRSPKTRAEKARVRRTHARASA